MSDNPADSLRREPPDWTEMQKTAAKALLDYRLRTYVEAIRSAPNYDAAHHEPLLKQQAQAAQLDWEQAKAVADAIWPLVSAALEAARADARAQAFTEAADAIEAESEQWSGPYPTVFYRLAALVRGLGEETASVDSKINTT